MSAPKKIFGTDGVRGTANVEPVTAETALKLGRAAGHVFKNLELQSRGRGKHKIVIGKDTRLSGYMLENAISSGILSMGVDVLFIGRCPRPALLTSRAACAPTRASSSPPRTTLTPTTASSFSAPTATNWTTKSKTKSKIWFSAARLKKSARPLLKSARPSALTTHLAATSNLRNPVFRAARRWKVCASSWIARTARLTNPRPAVLRELGAEVIVYGHRPDGMNINKDCGSMHPAQMCHKVVEHQAHIGIAHDGDADRVLLCDEKGKLIDGDDIMAISALDMIAQKTLAEKTLVATVMSNAGLEAVIKSAGGKMIRAAVGDKNVIDEMLRNGFKFGGEQSGHLIFRDFGTTGDGLVAALQILRIMKAKDQPLPKLAKCWTHFPQLVTNVKVREKIPFEKLDGVLKLVASAETELKSAADVCCCVIPARNRKRDCCGRPRRKSFGKLVKKNLRRDSEADWSLICFLPFKKFIYFSATSELKFLADKIGKQLKVA